MSDDVGDIWWERNLWIEAVLDADEGNPRPLVARLRSTAPITDRDRDSLAWLLERRRFRWEPRATEADEALADAAREVRALRAIQKKGLRAIKKKGPAAAEKFQTLARLNGGTLSIFDKNGKLNPLVSLAYAGKWSGDDVVMLFASPYIQKHLHQMTKDQLVEEVAKSCGVPEEALPFWAGGTGPTAVIMVAGSFPPSA